MNALEAEHLCLREIFLNVNKLLIVICIFCFRCPCSADAACLLVYPPFSYWCSCSLFTSLYTIFILILSLYFCLFVEHVNMMDGAFVFHLNKINSIFVTLLLFATMIPILLLFSYLINCIWVNFSIVLNQIIHYYCYSVFLINFQFTQANI